MEELALGVLRAILSVLKFVFVEIVSYFVGYFVKYLIRNRFNRMMAYHFLRAITFGTYPKEGGELRGRCIYELTGFLITSSLLGLFLILYLK